LVGFIEELGTWVEDAAGRPADLNGVGRKLRGASASYAEPLFPLRRASRDNCFRVDPRSRRDHVRPRLRALDPPAEDMDAIVTNPKLPADVANGYPAAGVRLEIASVDGDDSLA
jgi:hypothetical protein